MMSLEFRASASTPIAKRRVNRRSAARPRGQCGPALAVFALAAGLPVFGASLPPKVVIHTRGLTATLEASASWTLRSLKYNGVPVILPVGGQGAVLQTAGGQWVGSAMQRKISEPVESIDITGGTPERRTEGSVTLRGERVLVRKHSRLAGFRHTAETVFEADRFIQHHRFKAVEAMSPRVFYAFLYSFTTAATEWAAEPLSGALRRGAFQQTGDHVPGTACRWLAQFDPGRRTGVVIYFQTPFRERGADTCFWDAKSYHKLLAVPFRGRIPKGVRLEYTIVVQCFQAGADAWLDAARTRARALAKEFPPEQAAVAVAALREANPRRYAPGVPETGDLTLRTRHYTVRFEARPAWTIRRIEDDGKTIAGPTGWYGTVLVPKGGKWWGTGHTEGGLEIVRGLKLLVNGKPRAWRPGAVVSGHSATLLKESTIYKFRAHVAVTVTDEYILERTKLTAMEDADLKLMYYYMHCFVPSTTAWAAELPDGTLRTGKLDFNKGMSIQCDTRWVAQYEPNLGIGILCYTPKVISGPNSMSKIWNQPRYHKYYIQQNAGQHFQKGDTLDYSLVLTVAPGETGDWAKTRSTAAALEKRWPPVPHK